MSVQGLHGPQRTPNSSLPYPSTSFRCRTQLPASVTCTMQPQTRAERGMPAHLITIVELDSSKSHVGGGVSRGDTMNKLNLPRATVGRKGNLMAWVRTPFSGEACHMDIYSERMSSRSRRDRITDRNGWSGTRHSYLIRCFWCGILSDMMVTLAVPFGIILRVPRLSPGVGTSRSARF